MPEPRQHLESRGWIETVLKYVPGFSGYLEKEGRRESDALQREWLTDSLLRSKRQLDGYTRSLVDAGEIDALPECDRLRGRIDKIASRIRVAMRGYSGFFDLVQIDTAQLDRIYEFDAKMVEWVEQFSNNLDQISGRPESTSKIVRESLEQLEEFEQAWDQREDILKGLE